jgi:1-acyl-sn-glycerol-3-phosphate acyltransferase
MAKRDVGQLYPAAKAVLTPVFRFCWDLRVEGLEHIPPTGGAIIAPNHISVLDSFFVPCALPRRITYVGKAEYLDSFKTRHLFPALGMVPIDRRGGRQALAALDTASELLEAGELFGIYPEGTRSRDGLLHKGHTGVARLALRTGAPIIPVGLQGTDEVMPAGARRPNLFRSVRVRFGPPIEMSRYRGQRENRLLYRQIADELMYEIGQLSGQQYVDRYATRTAESLPAATAQLTDASSADRPGPTYAGADRAIAAV